PRHAAEVARGRSVRCGGRVDRFQLLQCRHGKVRLQAAFDHGTMGNAIKNGPMLRVAGYRHRGIIPGTARLIPPEPRFPSEDQTPDVSSGRAPPTGPTRWVVWPARSSGSPA